MAHFTSMNDISNTLNKWDKRYLEIARLVGSWSKDPSTNVGAIIVGSHGQILSQGYNGFPRNIQDDDRLNDREQKYRLIVHAEMNCLHNSSLSGISLVDSTLYSYGCPVCVECAKGIIQVGIIRVVMDFDRKTVRQKWLDDLLHSIDMFNESGVKCDIL